MERISKKQAMEILTSNDFTWACSIKNGTAANVKWNLANIDRAPGKMDVACKAIKDGKAVIIDDYRLPVSGKQYTFYSHINKYGVQFLVRKERVPSAYFEGYYINKWLALVIGSGNWIVH